MFLVIMKIEGILIEIDWKPMRHIGKELVKIQKNVMKKIMNKKIIFKSADLNIIEEVEDIYTFDIDSRLYTNDVMEAISYLVKNKKYDNERFWNLELKDNMVNYILPISSL